MMIGEVLGISVPKVSGCDAFQNCLYLFGSDFYREHGTANEDFSTQLIPYRMIHFSRMSMIGMSDLKSKHWVFAANALL